MIMNSVGELIAFYREKKGWTQTQLGEACGYTSTAQSRVSNYEKGAREPKIGELKKIAKKLEQPILNIIPGAWAEVVELGLAPPNPEDQEWLLIWRAFNSLSDVNKEVLSSTVSAMLNSQSPKS